MDAFKHAEILRMQQGGNEPWKSFFDNHAVTLSEGRTFDDSTIKERYEGEVGEEWKERLSAKIEGRDYVSGQPKPKTATTVEQGSSTRMASGTPGRDSPALREALADGGSRKERNEAFLAKLGSENASRSDSLPPSQGGRYTGFGGGVPATSGGADGRGPSGGGVPGFDDFQKDPMAALTKGFGWFTTAVGKGAKTMNDAYIQPTAKSVSSGVFRFVS